MSSSLPGLQVQAGCGTSHTDQHNTVTQIRSCSGLIGGHFFTLHVANRMFKISVLVAQEVFDCVSDCAQHDLQSTGCKNYSIALQEVASFLNTPFSKSLAVGSTMKINPGPCVLIPGLALARGPNSSLGYWLSVLIPGFWKGYYINNVFLCTFMCCIWTPPSA